MGLRLNRNQTPKQRQKLRQAARRAGIWASALGIFFDQREHFEGIISIEEQSTSKDGVTYRIVGPACTKVIKAKYTESRVPSHGVNLLLLMPPPYFPAGTTVLELFGLSTEERGIYQFEVDGRALDDDPGFKEFSQRTITTAETTHLMEGGIVAKLFHDGDNDCWCVEYKRIGDQHLMLSSLSYFLGNFFDGAV